MAIAVAEIFKEKRLARGLSHEAVAKIAEVHRTTVSRIESGKIYGTLFVFQSLSNAIDVPLSLLLKEAESRVRAGK